MRQIRTTAIATLAVLAAACTPTEQADGGPASAPAAAAPAPAVAAAPAPAPAAAPAPAPTVAAAPAPAPAPAPTAAAFNGTAGKALFNDWSCGTCHTLAAAGGTGGVGPSFDGNTRLTLEYATNVITNGQGAMPAFGGQMSDVEIATIASYIVAVKK